MLNVISNKKFTRTTPALRHSMLRGIRICVPIFYPYHTISFHHTIFDIQSLCVFSLLCMPQLLFGANSLFRMHFQKCNYNIKIRISSSCKFFTTYNSTYTLFPLPQSNAHSAYLQNVISQNFLFLVSPHFLHSSLHELYGI